MSTRSCRGGSSSGKRRITAPVTGASSLPCRCSTTSRRERPAPADQPVGGQSKRLDWRRSALSSIAKRRARGGPRQCRPACLSFLVSSASYIRPFLPNLSRGESENVPACDYCKALFHRVICRRSLRIRVPRVTIRFDIQLAVHAIDGEVQCVTFISTRTYSWRSAAMRRRLNSAHNRSSSGLPSYRSLISDADMSFAHVVAMKTIRRNRLLSTGSGKACTGSTNT